MTAPQVSVILPTFNRADRLRRSAGSVLAQSFTDLELLIVDDGSTDGTAAAAAALGDPRVRYIARPRNGGAAAARNTGVQAARGRYLAFQDSDDEWLLGKLARQVEALQAAGAQPHMVVCGLLRIRGQHVRRYPPTSAGTTLHAGQVLTSPYAYTQTWLVPRDAVVAAGGFDETLRVWDDWDLLIRLTAVLAVRVLTEPLVMSPISSDGISREHERFVEDMQRILSKHALRFAHDPAALAQVRYVQGRLLGMAGRGAEARRSLWQALSLRPQHWRAAVLLAAVNAGGTRSLKRFLERLESRQ